MLCTLSTRGSDRRSTLLIWEVTPLYNTTVDYIGRSRSHPRRQKWSPRVIYQTRCHTRPPSPLARSLSLSLPRLYIRDINVIFASRLVLPARLVDENRSAKRYTTAGDARAEGSFSKHHHFTSVRIRRARNLHARDTTIDLHALWYTARRRKWRFRMWMRSSRLFICPNSKIYFSDNKKIGFSLDKYICHIFLDYSKIIFIYER